MIRQFIDSLDTLFIWVLWCQKTMVAYLTFDLNIKSETFWDFDIIKPRRKGLNRVNINLSEKIAVMKWIALKTHKPFGKFKKNCSNKIRTNEICIRRELPVMRERERFLVPCYSVFFEKFIGWKYQLLFVKQKLFVKVLNFVVKLWSFSRSHGTTPNLFWFQHDDIMRK